MKTDIPMICRQAVQLAQRQGFSFDYTPESITELERMLMGQNELYRRGSLTDIYIWNLSVMMGAYLGQTLMHCGLREHGFEWTEDSDGVPLLVDGADSYVSPIYQVRTRLTGSENDNVRAFFEGVLEALG